MNISLTPVLESFVSSKVNSGLYNSSSEVVREALRIMLRHEGYNELTNFDGEIQMALDHMEQGKFLTDKELSSHIKARRQQFKNRKND